MYANVLVSPYGESQARFQDALERLITARLPYANRHPQQATAKVCGTDIKDLCPIMEHKIGEM